MKLKKKVVQIPIFWNQTWRKCSTYTTYSIRNWRVQKASERGIEVKATINHSQSNIYCFFLYTTTSTMWKTIPFLPFWSTKLKFQYKFSKNLDFLQKKLFHLQRGHYNFRSSHLTTFLLTFFTTICWHL